MAKNVFLFAVAVFLPQLADAAVTATLSNGALSLMADDSDNTIDVTCSGPGGNVQVDATDPSSGVVPCASISSLTVTGGAGNDAINLLGVLRSEFTALTAVSIDGGDGDDTIFGSPFNDAITGGAGNNWLDASTGDDTITIGAGNDIVYGNLGDDTIYLTTASGGRYIDGGTGNDTLFITATDANDEIDMQVEPPDPLMQNEVDTHVTMNGILMKTAFLETYQLSLGDGDDTVNAAIPPNGAIIIHGGSGNNTLSYDAQCQPATLADGSLTISGFPESDFDGFAAPPTVNNSFAFQANEVDVDASATSATAQLDTGAACAWTATSDSDWLMVGSTTGTGPGEIPLTLIANTSTDARTGHVMINGASVTVVQAGTSGSTVAGSSSGGSAPGTGTTTPGTTPTSTTTPGATVTTSPSATKHGCAATSPNEFFTIAAVAVTLLLRRRRAI